MRSLQESSCLCAVKEHSNLHEFFMLQSLIGVILVCLFAITIIAIIATSLLGGYLNKNGYAKLGNVKL